MSYSVERKEVRKNKWKVWDIREKGRKNATFSLFWNRIETFELFHWYSSCLSPLPASAQVNPKVYEQSPGNLQQVSSGEYRVIFTLPPLRSMTLQLLFTLLLFLLLRRWLDSRGWDKKQAEKRQWKHVERRPRGKWSCLRCGFVLLVGGAERGLETAGNL